MSQLRLCAVNCALRCALCVDAILNILYLAHTATKMSIIQYVVIASEARLLRSQWQLCHRMYVRTYVRSGPGGPVDAQHANVWPAG